MRFTFRITSGGDDYLVKFPEFETIESVKTDGRIDDAKVRKALKSWQDLGYVTFGDDNHAILALAVEFLIQLTSVSRKNDLDVDTRTHIGPKSKHDLTMERRYDQGKYAYIRIDFTSNAGGIRVRLSYSNRKDIVGAAIKSARDFAIYLARILAYIKREIEKSVGHELIRLEGVGDADDIFDEADYMRIRREELDRIEEAKSKRVNCPNHLGGYCSPVNPDCGCFAGGRCQECSLPEYFDSFEKFKKKGHDNGQK